METYYLYILYSEKIDRYYIGASYNPEERLQYHNTFPKGWTRRGRPWKLMYSKPFPTKEEAMKWERWIKQQKDRRIIQSIIDGLFQ
ncbi:MAG: excinuclease ABC subunit C, partial [Candidatus Brocadia sp. WS118]